MKKAVWGAFLLMTTLAAAGLCEMDYTLSNPHIRYEKIEGARQEEVAQADGAGISLSEMAAAQDVQQQEQQNQILVPQNIVDRCHDVCQNCFHFCFTSFISFWQIKNAASKMLRRENGREPVRFVLSHSVLLPERFSSFRCLAPSVPVFRDSPEPHPFLVVT